MNALSEQLLPCPGLPVDDHGGIDPGSLLGQGYRSQKGFVLAVEVVETVFLDLVFLTALGLVHFTAQFQNGTGHFLHVGDVFRDFDGPNEPSVRHHRYGRVHRGDLTAVFVQIGLFLPQRGLSFFQRLHQGTFLHVLEDFRKGLLQYVLAEFFHL